MKHNEIEQAVMELCDAVPDFTYKATHWAVFLCYGDEILTVCDEALPRIAQHAKHWAANQGWMPLRYCFKDSNTHHLCCVKDVTKRITLEDCTQWLKFDPTVLGSEELQWIRAVTEMAKLHTTQENT